MTRASSKLSSRRAGSGGGAGCRSAAALLPLLPPLRNHCCPLSPLPLALQLLIGSLGFASFAAASVYVHELKARRLDELIGPDDPDWPFLEGLLARHPRASAAVQPVPRSPPVPAFVARASCRKGQAELHYVDARGEEEDFSAIKCLR